MTTHEFSTGAPDSDSQERVGLLFTVVYALGYFGLWMALLTPVVVTMALRIAEIDPANKESTLALILGIGAFVALVANPVAGYFSDRTTSRFGMRRPWIVGGVLVGTFGLYLVATGGFAIILVGWVLAQLGFNAALAAIVAILPDQVPVSQRGTVSGVLGICLQLGVVAGVFVTERAGGNVVSMFLWPSYVCIALVLLLAVFLNDRRLDPSDVTPADLGAFAKSFWISPSKAPDFAWAFLSRFLLFIGLATLLTYQVYFLIDRLGVAPADIPGKMLTSTIVTTIATVLGSLTGGWMSDRLEGRRKLFVWLAAAIYASGLIVVAMSTTFGMFLVGLAVCGVGQGVYFAVDLALVTEVLPNKDDAAKDLGIFNIASAMPQSIAPAIAPIFLAIGGAGNNYGALYTAAGIFAALGALAIFPIRGVK
ncbi:MAG: MFS transporter [Amaricoccus sp.]